MQRIVTPTRALALLASVALSTSCIGVSLMGLHLGPNAGTGIRIRGAIPISVATNCTVTPGGTVFQGFGLLQLGTGQEFPNAYLAALDVSNDLDTNERQTTTTPNPSYGKYGPVNSNNVTLVGANVTYEFPTLSPAVKFSMQNLPVDGVVLNTGNTTSGAAIPSRGVGAVFVKVITKTLGDQMQQNAEVQTALGQGSVPVVANITLEGRTQSGGRVVSNDFSFEIDLVDYLDKVSCDATTQVTCPADYCLKYQDAMVLQCVTGTACP